jgi:hypothetical protein
MDCPQLQLSYSWTLGGKGEPQSADYEVGLSTTRPRFGGLRWWFICPLSLRDQPCERRVAKLYFPHGARHFGCRCCHDLTYQSVREHDKRVDALRRNPNELCRLLDDPKRLEVSQLLLALKALR